MGWIDGEAFSNFSHARTAKRDRKVHPFVCLGFARFEGKGCGSRVPEPQRERKRERMMCRKRGREKEEEEWKNSKRQTNRKRGRRGRRKGEERRGMLCAVEVLLVKVERKEEKERSAKEEGRKRVKMRGG